MKKPFVISVIILLILFTAIIKNSTKNMEEEIFTLNESIKELNSELDNVKLEFNYLSSSENLLKYQNQYFEDELIQKDIKDFKIFQNNLNKFEVKDLDIID